MIAADPYDYADTIIRTHAQSCSTDIVELAGIIAKRCDELPGTADQRRRTTRIRIAERVHEQLEQLRAVPGRAGERSEELVQILYDATAADSPGYGANVYRKCARALEILRAAYDGPDYNPDK